MRTLSGAEETRMSRTHLPKVAGVAALLVLLVGTAAVSGCESPHEPVPSHPAPAFGPDGAWREVQNALQMRNEAWLASRIARVAIPDDGQDPYTVLSRLTRALTRHVAPRLDHAMIVTDEPEVWLRFDRRGEFVGGRATLVVHVSQLNLFDHGESLAEWTKRLEREPHADPEAEAAPKWVPESVPAADAEPADGEPDTDADRDVERDAAVEANARSGHFMIVTHWQIERDDWRLQHLEIQDLNGKRIWRLATHPDT